MVNIHHVLKDGTEVESIEGRVIKAKEFPVLYKAMDRINKKEKNHEAVRTSN